MNEQTFTVSELAQRWKMSGETIRRMISDGELPNARKLRPNRDTSPYRIPLSDVLAHEQKLEQAVPFSLADGQ